jgi:hypothetical protein
LNNQITMKKRIAFDKGKSSKRRSPKKRMP